MVELSRKKEKDENRIKGGRTKCIELRLMTRKVQGVYFAEKDFLINGETKLKVNT